MNKTRSAKFVQTLFLAVSVVLAVLGVCVLSSARAGALCAKADSNYVKVQVIEYVSTWDGTNWGETVENEGTTIANGKYAYLLKPEMSSRNYKMDGTTKVYEGADNYSSIENDVQTEYTLVYWGVRFSLGGENTNIITTLTQSAEFNGERLAISTKNKIDETNTTAYHEYWVQNFYGVVKNTFETASNEDTTSKEAKANELFANLVTKYNTGNTPLSTNNYSELEGLYNFSYDYVPQNQSRIHEEFSYYLLTSDAYDVENRIVYNNVDEITNADNTVDTKNYSKKNFYQFDKTDGTQLLYPTLSYNPENFVISTNFIQYNYEEKTTYVFSKSKSIANGKTTEAATLVETRTFNNGKDSIVLTHSATTTYTQADLGDAETKCTVSKKVGNKPATLYADDQFDNYILTASVVNNALVYNVKLTFTTPGLYEIEKLININTTPASNTATYTTIKKDDIGASNSDAIFDPDALWIFGYTATYADEGVTQEPLFNNDLSTSNYVSDYSFLLDYSSSNEKASKNVSNKDFVVSKNGESVNNIQFEQENGTRISLGDNLANLIDEIQTSLIKATTNQAPVIFSSNFYLPNYDSTVEGWAYNKSANSYFKITKSTRFTEIGDYYVLMQSPASGRLDKNHYTENSENKTYKYVYQLFAFSITSSPVRPTIYKDTSTIETDYYKDATYKLDGSTKVYKGQEGFDSLGGETYTESDETLSVNGYTKESVYLSWQAVGPFEHSLKIEYYFNANYEEDVAQNGGYTTFNDYVTVGDKSYTRLFNENGFYKFKITSNKNTTAYYSFYIDNSTAFGVKAYALGYSTKTVTENETTTTTTISIVDATSAYAYNENNLTYLTNEGFAWGWGQKTSGATINAVRYWAPLTSIADYENMLLYANNVVEAVTTNAQITSFNSPIKYKSATLNVSEDGLTSSQMLKNSGIYILVLTDTAGNTASYVAILDNSSPTVFVGENPNSKDSTYKIGTYKERAYKLDGSTKVYEGDANYDALDGDVLIEEVFSFEDSYSTLQSEEKTRKVFSSETSIYNQIDGDVFVTEVTETTLNSSVDVYFGDYKAIKVNENALVIESDIVKKLKYSDSVSFEVDSSLFKKYNGKWYFVVENKSITINGSNAALPTITTSKKPINITIDKNDKSIKLYQNGTEITNLTDSFIDGNGNGQDVDYIFDIQDKLSNEARKHLYFSLDQSGVKFYAYTNETITNDEDRFIVVASTSIFSTNQNIGAIKWQTPENSEITIKTITVEYYPLLNNLSDVNGENYADYPYVTYVYPDQAESFTLVQDGVNINYNAFPTESGVVFISNAINTQIQNDLNLTKAGKYVVTRIYTDASLAAVESEGDSLTRTYTFIVDRNTVLDNTYANYLVTYGFDEEEYLNYTDYDKEFATPTNLETNSSISLFQTGVFAGTNLDSTINGNRLNVGIESPTNYYVGYKYSIKASNTQEIQTIIQNNLNKNYSSALKTIVMVQQQIDGSSPQFFRYLTASEIAAETNTYKDFSLLQEAFSNVGVYRVMIYDVANANTRLTLNAKSDFENMFNKAPNYSVFMFEITSESPNGTFESKQSAESNYNAVTASSGSAENKLYYTSNDYVIFKFKDTTDKNDAKIAYNDVTLQYTYSKYINSKGEDNIISKSNSPIKLILSQTEYSDAVALNTTTPTLYKDSQNNYVVVLPKIAINATYNSQVDATYNITLKYIESVNNEYSGKTYASKTFNIYIDHTAPYQNLWELIDNDTYLNELNNLFPQQNTSVTEYIKQHLDDPTFDFLNHYVFTVTEDFYLKYIEPKETGTVRYKEYSIPYAGTTATIVNSKDYYPENSKTFSYYTIYSEGVNQATNVESLIKNGANNTSYRPFVAGNYYDIIERDNSGNYRVYTIYVTKSGNDGNLYNNSNMTESSFAGSNWFASLNIINNETNEEGQEVVTTSREYYGLNASNDIQMILDKEYSKLSYSLTTFHDIATNAKVNNDNTVSINDKLYWLILKYTTYTNTGTTTKTILYFPSDDINSGRESINHIQSLQTILNLYSNSNVLFIKSKQDLLDTLNSIITECYNNNKNSSGSKIEFEFLNKVSGNPYYAQINANILEPDPNVAEFSGNYINLVNRNQNIGTKFKLTINTKGLDIVNNSSDFIESENNNAFILKIPASNISTYIKDILIAGSSQETSIMNDGMLTTNTFSINQSYRFVFVDNFETRKSFIYPIDSEYVQALNFKAGSSLMNYNGSTYNYTCGDTSFVYDSNNLSYFRLTITDILTGEEVYPIQQSSNNSEEQNGNTPTEKDFFETIVGNDGKTTINFVTPKNVYYKYEIKVGSSKDNPTTHTFFLYTMFPSVTITDVNGGNMLPQNTTEQLVTSKDLLVGLVSNSNALFNPHVYLSNGSWVSEILSDADTQVLDNGVYTITFVNDIGKYPAGTITFTKRTYDISVYGVYYNNNNNYTALTKRAQGYELSIPQTSTEEGAQPTVVTRKIDRFFFLSTNEAGWDNIVILLNENKQLSLVRDGNKNYVAEDTATRTRIYHVVASGSYNIDTYFAITRIPTATSDLVSDFRINGSKPLTTNVTQILPITADETAANELKASLSWNSSYVNEVTSTENTFRMWYQAKGANEGTYLDIEYNPNNNIIKDFYLLDLWVNGTFIGTYSSDNLLNKVLILDESGNFTIQVRDILGQYKTFSNGSKTYAITIYKDIVFSINDNNPIQNATFNDEVKLSVANIAQYQSGFKFNVTRNSSEFEAELVNGSYTFTKPGVYIVKMSGLLRGMGNQVDDLESEYQFTIISSNEARLNYDFAKRSGYTITKIVKDGEELEITPLYSLSLDATTDSTFGKGKYEITVSVKGEGLIPTMEYTYTIWINDETAILNSTRDWGTSSIAPFTIKLNPSVVFTRIGNCYVTVNGTTILTINEENSEENKENSYTFSKPGVYVVQMYSESGNLLSSQRITINEPLNNVAIALIVLASVVVVGLVIMFILIRRRQKVK